MFENVNILIIKHKIDFLFINKIDTNNMSCYDHIEDGKVNTFKDFLETMINLKKYHFDNNRFYIKITCQLLS